MTWRIRDFGSEDLDGVLHLWQSVSGDGFESVYSLAEILASCQEDIAVVAIEADTVVGAAVAREAYVDHSPPPPPKAERPAPVALRERGAGRPTKRDRRTLLDSLEGN